VRLLLVSGSLRAGSTNTALLRTALEVVPTGTDARLYAGLERLPHFNPDDDRELPPVAVRELRAELGWADAVLFSTPEYAGALPGSFKNLLDWAVGGGELSDLPVAWINASGPAAPTGAAGAHDSLRTVLGYTGSVIVEEACVRLPVLRQNLGPDGLIAAPDLRGRLASVLGVLIARVRQRLPEP